MYFLYVSITHQRCVLVGVTGLCSSYHICWKQIFTFPGQFVSYSRLLRICKKNDPCCGNQFKFFLRLLRPKNMLLPLVNSPQLDSSIKSIPFGFLHCNKSLVIHIPLVHLEMNSAPCNYRIYRTSCTIEKLADSNFCHCSTVVVAVSSFMHIKSYRELSSQLTLFYFYDVIIV